MGSDLLTIYLTFTEHVQPGRERRLLAETIDRDEVDELDDPRTPVCYFIVAGNDEGYFNIEPLSHEVTVSLWQNNLFSICVPMIEYKW